MPRPKGHKRLLLEDYGLIVDGHIIDPSPNDTGTCTEHKLTSYWVTKIYKLVKADEREMEAKPQAMVLEVFNPV